MTYVNVRLRAFGFASGTRAGSPQRGQPDPFEGPESSSFGVRGMPRNQAEERGRSKAPRPEPLLVDLYALGRTQLEAMAEAGREVMDCQRVLAQSGSNVVAEVLPQEGPFYQFDHCPAGDVYDRATHSQYYYHAHREGEHGHFHTFLREAGMPVDVRPVPQSRCQAMGERHDRLSHLIAISMDRRANPIGLFTTNRWVTGEDWYRANDVCAMLERFDIDHARPSWPTNRWVTAMLRLFRPQIVALLRRRDVVVEGWQRQRIGEDVFEDRDLDLPSQLPISVEAQIEAVREALAGRRRTTH